MGACPGGVGRSQDPAHVPGGQGVPFQRGEPGEKSWVVRGRASPRSGGLSGGSGVSPRTPPPQVPAGDFWSLHPRFETWLLLQGELGCRGAAAPPPSLACQAASEQLGFLFLFIICRPKGSV